MMTTIKLGLGLILGRRVQTCVKPRPPGAMQLRTCGHQFELPVVKYEFNKRNFIVRSIFNYV